MISPWECALAGMMAEGAWLALQRLSADVTVMLRGKPWCPCGTCCRFWLSAGSAALIFFPFRAEMACAWLGGFLVSEMIDRLLGL